MNKEDCSGKMSRVKRKQQGQMETEKNIINIKVSFKS